MFRNREEVLNVEMDTNYAEFRRIVRKEFAERLKFFRKSRGFTQREIAALLRVDRSAYACYEIGKSQPDMSGLLILADFYSVTLDELLGRHEKRIQEYKDKAYGRVSRTPEKALRRQKAAE